MKSRRGLKVYCMVYKIMDDVESKRTTMQITKGSLERLSKFGKFQESYETIIIKLLDHAEKCQKSLRNSEDEK